MPTDAAPCKFVDPECESLENINNWLKPKSIHVRVLNQKIDFSKKAAAQAIRQEEKWLPIIPLAPEKFSDVGLRYRENKFYSGGALVQRLFAKVQRFYDLTVFNSDTVPVGEDHMAIAHLYFRLSPESIEHERILFGVMDWLGAVAGIGPLLMFALQVLLGGYAQFNS